MQESQKKTGAAEDSMYLKKRESSIKSISSFSSTQSLKLVRWEESNDCLEMKICCLLFAPIIVAVDLISIVNIIILKQTISKALWSTRNEKSMIDGTGNLQLS